jgi:hypothetical protein
MEANASDTRTANVTTIAKAGPHTHKRWFPLVNNAIN